MKKRRNMKSTAWRKFPSMTFPLETGLRGPFAACFSAKLTHTTDKAVSQLPTVQRFEPYFRTIGTLLA